MSDRSRDPAGRRVWQPEAAQRPAPDAERRPDADALPDPNGPHDDPAPRSAEVRVLTPAQDRETADLSRELAAIAEQALGDRLQAEQIVAGLCRLQAGLVTTATRSAMRSQRDAARAELERLARRAALDALPPITTGQATDHGRRAATAGAGSSRIEAQTLATRTTRTEAQRPRTPEPGHHASPPEQRPMASDAAAHRLQAAGQPTSRPDLPPTVALPGETRSRGRFAADTFAATAAEAKQARRHRKLALSALALSVMLGGLGFGYVAYAPENVDGPELARSPNAAPGAATPAPEPSNGVGGLAEMLQLEAEDPSTGPLIERDIVAVPIRRPPSAEPSGIALPPELQLILVFQNTDAAAADRVRTTLATLKDPPAMALRSVDFTIATPRVRYFYADDATAAAALADLLGQPSNGTWQVQDFTHFRPGPTEGTLEVFITTSGG